jgi:hypothetical protein
LRALGNEGRDRKSSPLQTETETEIVDGQFGLKVETIKSIERFIGVSLSKSRKHSLTVLGFLAVRLKILLENLKFNSKWRSSSCGKGKARRSLSRPYDEKQHYFSCLFSDPPISSPQSDCAYFDPPSETISLISLSDGK